MSCSWHAVVFSLLMWSIRDFVNCGLFKETGGIEESRIWDEMQTNFLLLP